MTISILVLLLSGLILWFIWRLYSSRQSMPCPAWLAWMVELDNPFAKAHKASSIIESFSIVDNMKILDIGCGPGRVMLPLAQKIAEINGHVTGVDIQRDMINKTKLKAQTMGIHNIDFLHGTIDQIPLDKKCYDIAMMICVLGEIPQENQISILKKISAALKSNGIISITETIFDPHYQSRQTVIQLMQNAGFKRKKCIGNWLAYTMHFEKQASVHP